MVSPTGVSAANAAALWCDGFGLLGWWEVDAVVGPGEEQTAVWQCSESPRVALEVPCAPQARHRGRLEVAGRYLDRVTPRAASVLAAKADQAVLARRAAVQHCSTDHHQRAVQRARDLWMRVAATHRLERHTRREQRGDRRHLITGCGAGSADDQMETQRAQSAATSWRRHSM